MKFIFDFDDVLFHSTPRFKEHLRSSLEKAGISRVAVEEYVENLQGKGFSLKELLNKFSVNLNWYEKILKNSEEFINQDLLKIIKKLGRENCYIVSFGDREFQSDKIKRARIETLFSKITVVSDSKKEAIEKICAKHKDEQVIFVDDKAKHFANLDFKKYPNLKTILFDEQGLEKLLSILPQS
ncbi:MAG: HAD hydrolase-like protein [Candidatus Paceibacterota bacterium]|jgi:FMN phosphatase YigB (HAD superfamily)